jgi:hypothetical protein
MFETGWDQAAGLRAGQPVRHGASLMPVASPAQPARAYELLCTLAAHLKSLGRTPVILDGSEAEVVERKPNDGSHLGLLHALNDPAMAGLGHPTDGHEWLVMPAAQGLRALRQTALAAGAPVALSRLLSPFGAGSLLLLFAPAHDLTPLLAGLPARAMVPVLTQAQGSIDAYGAVKLLHLVGVTPVLAPMDSPEPDVPIAQALQCVTDCAQRHLALDVETWTEAVWGACVQENALARPVRHDMFHGLRSPGLAGLGGPSAGVVPQLWS